MVMLPVTPCGQHMTLFDTSDPCSNPKGIWTSRERKRRLTSLKRSRLPSMGVSCFAITLIALSWFKQDSASAVERPSEELGAAPASAYGISCKIAMS